MLLASENLPERLVLRRTRNHRRAEEPFLRALLPLERILDARERQTFGFYRADEGLERPRLRIVVRAADEDAVAARLDREDRRLGDGVGVGDRFHLEVVAEDDA